MIQRIKQEEKTILEALLVEYLSELSLILNESLDTNYAYTDTYFTEKNRIPFFILHNKEIIGFALVNDFCLLKTNEIAIAEFFVRKEYRNKGYAFKAAREILNTSSKKWEVKTNIKNKTALVFWQKVLKKNEGEQVKDDIVFSYQNKPV